jgi:hypothetical protein
MVTEKDILEGKCGPKVTNVKDAIIPKTAKEVPKNKFVYQFYDDNESKYPGFHKQKTPSGLCIPCCYSKWSTAEMKNRRDICQGKFEDKAAQPVSKEAAQIEQELRREVKEVEHYVKGPEKYGPQLGEHRWGFLPISVQKFLHEVNEDCQISKNDMNLKLNHVCILRHGVEVHSTQSFIACISSAMFYAQTDVQTKKPLITKFIPGAKHTVPSIQEMKTLIINAINIDNFITYQNGDLIESFSDATRIINIDNYKTSNLYKKMNKGKKITKSVTDSAIKETRDEEFVTKVIQSFENFTDFLNNKTITIDYTYLWDIICTSNPLLFNAGINLIILEMPEDDSTNNIDLVCPTNHYSLHAYDARKRSILLIKRENYFEPIYAHRNDGKTTFVTTTFTEYDKKMTTTLRAVFSKIIKPTLGEKCKYFPSRPTEYRFQQAPILDKLIEMLIHKKYTISTQILNFQGKVIGVLTKNPSGLEGFVPCFPSALTRLMVSKSCDTATTDCGYDFIYMNDDIWKSYEETLSFLKEYYDYKEPINNKTINCYNPKYFCRVSEQELITGFLTNTNQFVPIKDPIPVSSVEDSIKTINEGDMLVADINTLTNKSVDSKRVNFIKKIQLETNFYNVFRNTIRILFNDYSNSDQRKQIKDECNKKYTLYKHQLDSVIKMLYKLVGDSVVFAEKDKLYDYKTIDENEIHNCIKNSKDKCNKKGSICIMTDDKCTLILPKENLVTNTDNERYYYGRMADELIRYNRIKSFMFKPQTYLSFGQIKYNLRDDEIIVLQDLLNNEFFENLIPTDINVYAKYNTYDTAAPIITQKYTKEIPLNDVINPHHDVDCIPSEPTDITTLNWRKCFPSNYKEVVYDKTLQCSLYLIINLINEFKGQQLTIEGIKDILIEEYARLTNNFTNQNRIRVIIDILREEGQIDANQLQDETINFEQMIIQNGFMAVNFDLWLLLVRFKIPSIFISSKLIPETRYNSYEFVCYKSTTDSKYIFIVTPAMFRRKTNKFAKYGIIVNNEGNKEIDINETVFNNNDDTICLRNITKAIEDDKKHYSVEHYLDFVYKKDITTDYKDRKQGLRDIIERPLIQIVEPAIVEDNPPIYIEPIKKRKTKKQRELKIKVNPPGNKTIQKYTKKQKIERANVKRGSEFIIIN